MGASQNIDGGNFPHMLPATMWYIFLDFDICPRYLQNTKAYAVFTSVMYKSHTFIGFFLLLC